MNLAPSFRTRILLVVLMVGVVPMALLGLWLTRTASRSGQDLLRTRLEQALELTAARIGSNWLKQRSDLLFLGEHDEVQRALLLRVDGADGDDGAGVRPVGDADPPARDPAVPERSAEPGAIEAPPGLVSLFDGLGEAVLTASIRDMDGAELWTLTREPASGARPGADVAALHVRLPVHQRFPGREIGSVEARIRVDPLIGEAGGSPSLAGVILAVEDVVREAQLLPLPFDPVLLDGATFSWGDDDWLTARRRMAEPPLLLVTAAPLSPFVGPFQDAARRGTWMLAIVAVLGLTAAWLLTGRLTGSLERLAGAAEAVSEGELDTRVEGAGRDEVGRVAHAFNTMTASLRRTLDELADRERLAAVGEFAATLAHEVRNPLTAIRIDLQRVEERLPGDSPLREPQARALREISRLDATVSETLDVARTGRWRTGLVDLAVPLKAAADAALPAFVERDATLDRAVLDRPLPSIRGDPHALEQLFLNLLLNAAAALGPGGRAWFEVEEHTGFFTISVCDSGTGIPPEMLDRVFQPLYTTRPDGTGLGLTVAQRIVEQHGGRIDIASEVGRGTKIGIQLSH